MKKSTKKTATRSGKSSGIINVEGHCLDCGENWSGPSTAMTALRHHEATGHHVRVEQTLFWERFTKPTTINHQPTTK